MPDLFSSQSGSEQMLIDIAIKPTIETTKLQEGIVEHTVADEREEIFIQHWR